MKIYYIYLDAREARVELNRWKICLKERQSIAIKVKYGKNRTFFHSATLWFDNNKTINLYDPVIEENINTIDKALRPFFSSELPSKNINCLK